jgi:hypothetical protein
MAPDSCMEETTADVGTYPQPSSAPRLRISARRLILTSTTEKEHLSPRKYDHESCQELASHLINAKGLPAQCLQYTDVVTMIRRRETDRTDGTEILS